MSTHLPPATPARGALPFLTPFLPQLTSAPIPPRSLLLKYAIAVRTLPAAIRRAQQTSFLRGRQTTKIIECFGTLQPELSRSGLAHCPGSRNGWFRGPSRWSGWWLHSRSFLSSLSLYWRRDRTASPARPLPCLAHPLHLTHPVTRVSRSPLW